MFRFIKSTNTEKLSTVQDFDDVSVKEYLDYNVQIALRNLQLVMTLIELYYLINCNQVARKYG